MAGDSLSFTETELIVSEPVWAHCFDTKSRYVGFCQMREKASQAASLTALSGLVFVSSCCLTVAAMS